MYDSFLYGYGLTLSLFSDIEEIETKKNASIKYYFNYTDFLKAFLHAKEHKKILRDFNKYFELNTETQRAHGEAREFIIREENEIYSIGFERWISKHIFTKDNPQLDYAIIYSYLLYNYWYHLLYTQVLQYSSSGEFIKRAGLYIQEALKKNAKIYTTNFDTLLDNYLSPEHLHGTFALPLSEMRDAILDLDRKEDRFQYVYLLGTNGVEKRHRLNLVRELEQDYYDLDFFYDDNISLGHLLIYGMSFGYNQIITEDFLKEHPEQEDFNLLRSVDGHIISRLESLFEEGRLEKITIGYYTEEDLRNIKFIFNAAKFKDIVDFKHSSSIFDFHNLH